MRREVSGCVFQVLAFVHHFAAFLDKSSHPFARPGFCGSAEEAEHFLEPFDLDLRFFEVILEGGLSPSVRAAFTIFGSALTG